MKKPSILTTLSEQAKVAFFSEIEGRKADLLAMEAGDALSALLEEIGTVIDTLLDERSDDYMQMLLLCCLECPDLFTAEPGSLSCVTQNESPGQVSAQHCVYHNLYDLLRRTLEDEFEEWHRSKGEREPGAAPSFTAVPLELQCFLLDHAYSRTKRCKNMDK